MCVCECCWGYTMNSVSYGNDSIFKKKYYGTCNRLRVCISALLVIPMSKISIFFAIPGEIFTRLKTCTNVFNLHGGTKNYFLNPSKMTYGLLHFGHSVCVLHIYSFWHTMKFISTIFVSNMTLFSSCVKLKFAKRIASPIYSYMG